FRSHAGFVGPGAHTERRESVQLELSGPPDFSVGGTGQFKLDDSASLGVGAWTNETSMIVKGKVGDSDDENVKMQIEIRRIDVPFDESTATFYDSSFVGNGSIAQVTVPLLGPAPGQYHWRARS